MTLHTKKDVRDKICDICSNSFVTDFQLKRHMKEIHIEGSLPCEFEGCSKKFHKASKLKRHMRSHTKEKPYICDKCSNAYTHASHLYRHQEAVHLGIVYPCGVPGCQTNFRRRDDYRTHLKKSHQGLDKKGIRDHVQRAIKIVMTTK
jgi:uncharacterized Zn-finger protein